VASRDAGRRGSLGLCGARFEWRRLLAELGGTFFLVLVAAGADVVNAVGGGQVGRAAAVTAPGIMVLALIYDTVLRTAGDNPFLLDSPRPRIPLAEYTSRERRYRTPKNTTPLKATGRWPPAARPDSLPTCGAKRPRDPGHLTREFNGRFGQA
jgi:hypothetical protein